MRGSTKTQALVVSLALAALKLVATSLTESRATKAFSQALVARAAVLAYRVGAAKPQGQAPISNALKLNAF